MHSEVHKLWYLICHIHYVQRDRCSGQPQCGARDQLQIVTQYHNQGY